MPKIILTSHEETTMSEEIKIKPGEYHLYEGLPNKRLEENAITSRFRPKYRPLSEKEKQLHDAIKEKAAELELLYDAVKPGRYNSLAVTSLEQSVMWIVKELTA